MRRFPWRIILLIIFAVGLLGLFWYAQRLEQKASMANLEQNIQESQETVQRQAQIAPYQADIRAAIGETLPGIVCMGDEAIIAGENTLAHSLEQRVNKDWIGEAWNKLWIFSRTVEETRVGVSNFCVLGEGVRNIAIRAGGRSAYVASDVVIPESGAVALSFVDDEGREVRFKTQLAVKLSPVLIDGIEGVFHAKSRDSEGYIYPEFTRREDGLSHPVAAGTPLVIEIAELTRDDLLVLFVGDVGGDEDAYIQYLRDIIAHQGKHRSEYIVVSPAAAGSSLDQKMQAAFAARCVRAEPGEDGSADFDALSETIFSAMEDLGYFEKIDQAIAAMEEVIAQADTGAAK